MTNNLKGGRGKRAPYETVMCRTPKPIKFVIEERIAKYRELVNSYENPEDPQLIEAISPNDNSSELQQLRNEVKSLEIKLRLARKKAKEFEEQLTQAEKQIHHLQNGGAVKVLTSKIRELELNNYKANQVDEKSIILCALSKFVDAEKENYGKNGAQKNKEFNLNTRKWDALRNFQSFIESQK